jgi:hypothetical protein
MVHFSNKKLFFLECGLHRIHRAPQLDCPRDRVSQPRQEIDIIRRKGAR